MNGFDTYDDLLAAVDRTGQPTRTLGYAPGGRPIVSVRTGGDETPGVVITAGAHATEQAGVCAAVELIEALDTHREVHIVPSRDPVGIDGFDAAVGLACDHEGPTTRPEEAVDLLRREGEIIHEGEAVTVGLIGDYGYAVSSLEDGGGPSILQRFKEYTEIAPEVLDELAGRRVFTAAGYEDVDAAAPFERTYTLIIAPNGRPLHLNRFFTDAWAPPETRAVRRLMDTVEPGIMFDNHETTGHDDRYHVSLRPQRTAEGDDQEQRIGRAIAQAVAARGTELATDEDILSSPTKTVAEADEEERPDDGFYSRAGDGAYWVDPNLTSPPRLGEGLNATDYAAEEHGLAFTLETGMYGTLERRVADAVTSVQAGVREFEAID